MAQFDVYRNANPATQVEIPYLVELQHDLLERLATRVAAPLVQLAEVPRPISRLNLLFVIEGADVVLSTQELAGVPTTCFGDFVVSVADRRDDIVAALDLLFMGI